MPGPFTLAEIVSQLGGHLLGDPATLIRQVGSLERASAEQITFLASTRHRPKLLASGAAAVVLSPEAQELTTLPRIVCQDPYLYFARVSRLFNPTVPPEPAIDASAQVADNARIASSARIDAGVVVGEGASVGERVWIGAGSYVGAGSTIGDDSRLYPSVVLYHGCHVGARAIIHSGAVVGADGFGLASDDGRWVKIPQIGRVWIGDDVEVGANTTIDRGTIDDTVIEDGVKLDNQIQIGHNVRIGAHTAIAGCVGIAGSTQIGRHCAIGGAAMIIGHLRIVDHVTISAGTMISSSIHKAGTYTGIYPFDDNSSWVRNAAYVRQLEKLADRIRMLEMRLEGRDKND
ncbi:MAG: UDP-3-O-(3-hydroxymyristoyl)glucosamine N-acyltransferase [Burkholderiales bacterium]